MTRQIRDRLLFKNKDIHINQDLLNRYFRIYPERYFKTKYSISGLWKGYIATFELLNNHLFVKKIELLVDGEFNFELVNDFDYEKPCEWYSGFIRIDSYRDEFDDEENPNSIYEFLEFKRGVLKKEHRFNHSDFVEFKNSLYEKFKQMDEYQKKVAYWKNAGLNDEETHEYIYPYFMDSLELE